MSTDEIVTGNADGEFGLEPSHRSGSRRGLTCKMRIPETPVQIGSFYVSSIDRGTGRIGQSGANTLLAAVDHLAFDLDHTPILAGFMNRSVIQIGIYDPLRLTGSAPFACRRHRDQLVKQFSKDRTVMRQFVGNKQWLALKATGQILEQLSSIVQFAPTDPERNQKSRGGVDGRPDPGLSVLALKKGVKIRFFRQASIFELAVFTE